MSKRLTPRQLGLWMGQLPAGEYNAITDVPGVKVGHVSIVRGYGKLIPGQGPVRTGVTVILPPRKNLYVEPCWAGIDVFNGFGKSVGVPFIQETGILNSPVLLTNTLSVNDVANGIMTTLLQENPAIGHDLRTANLVVLECDDSYLNDIQGRHVQPSDVFLAIKRATGGELAQGNVGAGVGMSCFQFKGGIGSSSRIVNYGNGRQAVLGVLALTNFGVMPDFLLNGVPLGSLLPGEADGYLPGSLIMVGMTDAPLSRWQLTRVAQRCMLGTARTGGVSMTGSGDFALMISTAPIQGAEQISDWDLDNFHLATVEAGAESIWNSLFLAETMEGRDCHVRYALPIKRSLDLIKSWAGGLGYLSR